MGVTTWPCQGAGSSKAKSTRTAKRRRSASARRAKKKQEQISGGHFKRASALASGKRRKRRAGATGKASKIGRATRATRTRSRPSKRATARSKKPAAKKAKLYTRYDPTTGQKVRVTNDTFEYRYWPSRKPSKRKLLGKRSRQTPSARRAASRSKQRSGQSKKSVSTPQLEFFAPLALDSCRSPSLELVPRFHLPGSLG